MALEELAAFDRKGILPNAIEDADAYANRAKWILGTSAIRRGEEDKFLFYVQQRLREENGSEGEVGGPFHEDIAGIKKMQRRVENKFGCDLSWIPVVYAELGIRGNQLIRGLAFPPERVNDRERKLFGPPFIVINSSCIGRKRTVLHELLHMPPMLCGLYDVNYAGTFTYEETLAETANVGRAIFHSIMHPVVSFEFAVIRERLKRAFGKNGDYVLIRTTYDEARDFYYDKILGSPRETICVRAEKGHLKYKLMKERLRL